MKKVKELLGGSSTAGASGELQICLAPKVGDGFFHKEGSNVRSWKYRSYSVFEGGLLQYYASGRMIRGQIDLSVVEFSRPEKGRLQDFIPSSDSSSVGLCMYSIRESREMCVVFKAMEECMYFLYFVSIASPQNNVTIFISSIGMQQQFIACMERYKAIKARSASLQGADFYYYDKEVPQSPEAEDSGDTTSPASDASGASPYQLAGASSAALSSPAEHAQPDQPAVTPSISRPNHVGAIDSMFLSLISEDASYTKMLALLRSRVILGEEFPHLSRAVWWRLSLNLLSKKGTNRWAADLTESIAKYYEMKKDLLPVLSATDVDPLMTTGNIESPVDGEWAKYYKVREIANFTQLDIDRLYLNGVDEAYFEDRDRCVVLQNILLIWAIQNEEISYRQGMHEVAGVVLIVVENELSAWTDSSLSPSDFQRLQRHPLKGCFTRENVEPYAYWMFDKIMEDLKVLFDPKPDSNGSPKVVQYCNNVQDVLLRNVDSDLSLSIEGQSIQSQLYGMRWSRLMLSREFSSIERHVLRIWDYIFVMASCGDSGVGDGGPSVGAAALKASLAQSVGVGSLATSPTPGERTLGTNPGSSGVNFASSFGMKPKSILEPLRYVMVAMLVNIRNEILENDSCTSLNVLMRYPDVPNARTIIELSYLIAKGVYKVSPVVDDSARPRQRPLVYRGLQRLGSTVAQTIAFRGPLIQALAGTVGSGSGPVSSTGGSSVATPTASANYSSSAYGAPATDESLGGAEGVTPSSSVAYADASGLPSVSLWPSKLATPSGQRAVGNNQMDGGFEMEMGDVDSVIGPSSNNGKSKNAPSANIASPVASTGGSAYRSLAASDVKSFLAVGRVLIAEGDRLVKAADAASIDAYQQSQIEEGGIGEDKEYTKKEGEANDKPGVKALEVDTQVLAEQLRYLADVLVRARTWEEFESFRQEKK